MATIASITNLPTGNEATITFSNGYQMLVRIVDVYNERTIVLTPSHKLVAITKGVGYECKVLAEGVSIR